jgi:hypothetical protein
MIYSSPIPSLYPRSDRFSAAAVKKLEKLAVLGSQHNSYETQKRNGNNNNCFVRKCTAGLILIYIVTSPSLSLFEPKEVCMKCFGLSIDCSAR